MTSPTSYPGQYFDSETGLHYNYFRDYDPKTGRYIEPDPAGLGGGINPYSYVGANPLSWIDPLGLFEGQWPPPPPAYDSKTWKWGQWPNGKYWLKDPSQREPWTMHPEDRPKDIGKTIKGGHWRHWDKGDEKWPPNSKKPRFRQKELNCDQSETDPSGDAPSWEPEGPPSTDPFGYNMYFFPFGLSPPGYVPVPLPEAVPVLRFWVPAP